MQAERRLAAAERRAVVLAGERDTCQQQLQGMEQLLGKANGLSGERLAEAAQVCVFVCVHVRRRGTFFISGKRYFGFKQKKQIRQALGSKFVKQSWACVG